MGEVIATEIRKQGLLQTDAVLVTALVDMYAKCGRIEKAREVFKCIPIDSVAPWNALIAGYAQHGLFEEALKCFEEMKLAGVHADAVTFTSVSECCCVIGSLEIGESIYVEATKQGLLYKEMVLGNALVHMYAKCGAADKSKEIFEALPTHDVVSWNALISGYAQLGQANAVSDLFMKMGLEQFVPDSATFTLLLALCSHAGLLKEGEKVFKQMSSVYGIVPTVEHYSCTIDLYGRAGCLAQAKAVLDSVPCSVSQMQLFLTLMGACRKWGSMKLAQRAFEESQLHKHNDNDAVYVCIESVYASGGMEMV
jgi:pentatricopeptide repeat protein